MKPIRHLVAAIGLATALASGAMAEDAKVTLRFGHWIPPQYPFHKDAEAWAKAIEKDSGGTIEIKLFPAQQLGAAKDHYDMTKNGVVDIAWINMGYTPGRFPAIEIADIPMLIKSADGGSKALQEWYAPIAEKEMADVKLCLVHLGPAGTLHSKKPVKRPADLKGLRVRPGSGALAQFIADNGGSAVQVPAPEARQALERGVADAITFPWGSLVLFGIDKTVNHHVDAPIYFVGAAQVMNKASYAKLSPAQKKVIDGHCGIEAAGKFVTGWVAWEAEGRAKLGAMSGHTFQKLEAADLAAWQDGAKPLLARWSEAAKKAGHDPDALLKSFRAALARHNAAN